MGIMMKFIGISKKNNAQKGEHNLLKPTHRAPVYSTLTTVCGEVMAVGGRRGDTTTGDVYQLRQREWVRIGGMILLGSIL